MKWKRLAFCAFMVLIPAAILLQGGDAQLDAQGFSARAEQYVRAGMPFQEQLSWLSRGITSVTIRKEVFPSGHSAHGQRGIFIGNNGMMRNIEPPVQSFVEENISGAAAFAESMRNMQKATYFMLIPTAGAILQQNLPPYADAVMVNQREFIDGVYSRISGGAVTIDAYQALINRQSQYIYYRTEDNLTSLGGYFVYSAMLSRLGLGQAELRQFDITYTSTNFYGDLYDETGYRGIPADIISLYRYSGTNRTPREHVVIHSSGGERKVYHTLFPTHTMQISDPLDVFFGGSAAVIDVHTASPYSAKLLVFCDKTAISYAPFLANNCARMTLVDLSRGGEALDGIDVEQYDAAIFAYGVESFMHTNHPARASALAQ